MFERRVLTGRASIRLVKINRTIGHPLGEELSRAKYELFPSGARWSA